MGRAFREVHSPIRSGARMIGPGPDTTDMAFFNTQGYLRKGWRGFRGSSAFINYAITEIAKQNLPYVKLLCEEAEVKKL